MHLSTVLASLLQIFILVPYSEAHSRSKYPPGIPHTIYEETDEAPEHEHPKYYPPAAPSHANRPKQVKEEAMTYPPGVPKPRPVDTLQVDVKQEVYSDPRAEIAQEVRSKVKERQPKAAYAPGVPHTHTDRKQSSDEEQEEMDSEEPVYSETEKQHKPDLEESRENREYRKESKPNHHPKPRHNEPPPQIFLELGRTMTLEEREHLREHLSVPIDTSTMSDLELAFHQFKVHDTDNNTKLDGLELVKFVMHYHKDDEGHHQEQPIFTDEQLMKPVDAMFKGDDLNNDGFISPAEFFASFMKDHKKREREEREKHKKS